MFLTFSRGSCRFTNRIAGLGGKFVWTMMYSETCELRPPNGLGISGPISQVVSFARFGSKIFNMKLYTGMTCVSHQHQRSVVPTCTRGRSWQRPCKRDDCSFGVPAKEKLDNQKSVFRSIWHNYYVVAFRRLNRRLGRPPVYTIRISQVAAFSRAHSVHLNPRIKGTKIACPQFSGGRFCQVVAMDRCDCIRTSPILTQLSHCSVDRAWWQAKVASIELWIPWCYADRAHMHFKHLRHDQWKRAYRVLSLHTCNTNLQVELWYLPLPHYTNCWQDLPNTNAAGWITNRPLLPSLDHSRTWWDIHGRCNLFFFLAPTWTHREGEY